MTLNTDRFYFMLLINASPSTSTLLLMQYNKAICELENINIITWKLFRTFNYRTVIIVPLIS